MTGQAQANPAQERLFYEVFLPAFVEKSAELGRPITSEEELQDRLQIAAMTGMAQEGQTQSTTKVACASLKAAMGIDVQEKQAAEATTVKSAASALKQNPDIRSAVLSGLQLQ